MSIITFESKTFISQDIVTNLFEIGTIESMENSIFTAQNV